MGTFLVLLALGVGLTLAVWYAIRWAESKRAADKELAERLAAAQRVEERHRRAVANLSRPVSRAPWPIPVRESPPMPTKAPQE